LGHKHSPVFIERRATPLVAPHVAENHSAPQAERIDFLVTIPTTSVSGFLADAGEAQLAACIEKL
jgi:hypothetical protein